MPLGVARPSAPLALLLWCIACDAASGTAPRGQVITQGTPDDGDPSVVALLESDGRLRCTGTLIAPRVVVTAAHCAIEAGSESVFFGNDLDGPGDALAIADVHSHPDYTGATGLNDIALLFVDAWPPAEAASLPSRALDESFVDTEVRLVGFGRTAVDLEDGGKKREGTARVARLDVSEFELEPAPAQTCLGDSGGPTFAVLDGVEVLVGVTARGDSACEAYAISTRVDAHLDSFIQPYLDQTAEGTAAVGERCLYAEQCVSGTCVVAPDEPRIRYCSQPCDGRADCPDEMTCSQGLCAYPLPTPGALGAPCTEATECASQMCAAPPEADELRCTQRCIPGGNDCGAGFDCVNTVGVNFICVPLPAEEGCSCKAHRTPAPAPLLWTLVVAFAISRRRRRR